jgi:hypothetical protein
MTAGQQRDLAFCVKLRKLETGDLVEGQKEYRDVSSTVAQHSLWLADTDDLDVHLRATRDRTVDIQQLDQEAMAGSGLSGEHDVTGFLCGTLGAQLSGLNCGQGRSPLAQQHLAGSRERHSSPRAFEEDDSEPLLQLRNRTGQWWLSHPESVGGVAKVQFFGDGDEIAKLAGLH